MRRTWPYSQPPNVPFEINRASPQSEGLALWLPWGGGTPGSHRHVDLVRGLEFTEGGTPTWAFDAQHGWSMLFDDASNEYLEVDQAVVLDAPLTMTCQFNSDAWAPTQTLIYMGDKDTENNFALLRLIYIGGRKLQAIANWKIAQSVNTFASDTWCFGCGVLVADDERYVYLNDGDKASNTDSTVLVGHDRTSIGRMGQATPTLYMSGNIKDVRIYNAAKSDAEVHQIRTEPWELCRPLTRWWTGWRSPVTVRVPRYGFTNFQVPGIV